MRIAVVLSVIAGCGTPPAPQSPHAQAPVAWSEQSFEPEVARQLERRFPGATVTSKGDATFSVAHPPPQSALEVSFAKPRQQCRADWSTCQAAVEHMLDAIAEISSRPAVAPAQLRIVLRANAKIERVK